MREVGYAVCAAMVAASVFTMLLPRAAHSKSVMLVIRIFLILTVVLVLKRQQIDLSEPFARFSEEQSAVANDLSLLANEQVVRYMRENLLRQAKLILQKHGIEARKIDLKIHIDEEDRIDISSLTVVLTEEYSKNCTDAIEELNETFSLTVNVQQEG